MIHVDTYIHVRLCVCTEVSRSWPAIAEIRGTTHKNEYWFDSHATAKAWELGILASSVRGRGDKAVGAGMPSYAAHETAFLSCQRWLLSCGNVRPGPEKGRGEARFQRVDPWSSLFSLAAVRAERN